MYKIYSRYLRHIVLPEFGIKKQDKLMKSKILCVGAGGLGSPVITYLGMLGIGRIDIIDSDFIEISNLNRQFIYKEKDVGKEKAKYAKIYLKQLNKNVKIKKFNKILDYKNCTKIIRNYDVIIDCTDNLKTKILLSDCGIKLNIPIVHAAIFGYEGYVTILKKNLICYRCMYNNLNINLCVDHGVFGPIAGLIGIIQASETMKIITNEKSLQLKILFINIKKNVFKILNVTKNLNCNIC